MNNKPTYKEYAHNKIGNVVRTEDGRFFYNCNYKIVNLTVFLLLILCQAGFFFVLKNEFSHNLYFDYMLIIFVFYLFLTKILYRISRFEEILPDSEDYVTASDGFAKKKTRLHRFFRLLAVPIGILVLLFFILNSFSVFYIRSIVENHPIMARAESYNDRNILSIVQVSDETYRIVVPKNESPAIVVRVRGTALKAQAIIDGQPMTKWFHRKARINWFWEDKYLRSDYYILLSRSDIHDGSILEMTCGGMYRKWVFDLTDEG